MTMHVVCDPSTEMRQLGATEEEIGTVRAGVAIIERCFARGGTVLSSPGIIRDFLRLRTAGLGAEVFGVIWLDTQHRVIATEELFRGSLTQTSVHPRELVRRGLQLNAAAALVYHNHPSGVAEPSRSDEFLTRTIKLAFALVDIKLSDHLVVGRDTVVSLAERGLL